MTASLVVPWRRWSSRLALLLAVIAAFLNAAIALQYGGLRGSFFWEATYDDIPFDVSPGFLMTILVAGQVWYATPVLWLLVMVLWLTGPGGRLASVAMVLATLSVLAFIVLNAAFARLAF